MIGYVKRSFLCGRRFTDLDDLNRQFTLWQDTVANVRIHGTTGRQPVQLYREEVKHLRPSEAVPVYDSRPAQIRKVGRDSHIRYCGVFYSVDPCAAGRVVVLRPQGERLGDEFQVYCGQKLVAVHYRRAQGTSRVTLTEHAAHIRRLTRGKRPRRGRRSAAQFEQVVACELSVDYPAVEVQTRSLALYESLVGVQS